MRQSTHMQGPWSVLALAAALLTVLPAQAALTAVTLDSGLQASQDAATGLLWRSFDAAAAGAQAGFRQATVADFDTLLRGNTYAPTGTLPYALSQLGTAPIVITPAVTQTVTTEVYYTSDGSALPQAFLDQQAIYKAQYEAALQMPHQILTPTQLENSYYKGPMFDLQVEYDVYSKKVTETKVITPAVTILPPALKAGDVSASYYSSDASSGFQVDGMHEYDNSYSSFAPEYHRAFIGQVAAGESFWVGATTSNYIPHQCQPGDSGYNQYSNQVQYCGGRAYTTAYLGPEGSTEFSNSSFSRTDYLTGTKPFGYLMVKAVPEPSTYALMGLGLVAMAWVRSRRSLRNS